MIGEISKWDSTSNEVIVGGAEVIFYKKVKQQEKQYTECHFGCD